MYHEEQQPDLHEFGLAVKRAREGKKWTQAYLAQLVGREPRTIMYIENRGQHPHLDVFYRLATLLDISVDQFFFPNQNQQSAARKGIDILLDSLDEDDLMVVAATAQALKDRKVE